MTARKYPDELVVHETVNKIFKNVLMKAGEIKLKPKTKVNRKAPRMSMSELRKKFSNM